MTCPGNSSEVPVGPAGLRASCDLPSPTDLGDARATFERNPSRAEQLAPMTPEEVMAVAYRVARAKNPHYAATPVSVREIRCMAALLVTTEEALRHKLLDERESPSSFETPPAAAPQDEGFEEGES